MFSTSRVGSSSSSTGSTSMSWFSSRVESTMSTSASGGAHAFDLALEHVLRDPLVERARGEAVHAGEVDQVELTTAPQADTTDVLLDRDARVVRDLLTQAGQLIEEGRLPRVRRADERDEREVVVVRYEDVQSPHRPKRRRGAARPCASQPQAGSFRLDSRRTQRQSAVSRRSARREPRRPRRSGSPPGEERTGQIRHPGRTPRSRRGSARSAGRSMLTSSTSCWQGNVPQPELGRIGSRVSSMTGSACT